ncbi:alanine racemase [Nocardioides daphniae]|uniref:Alanine racemase n=1 Tax=Nocardioides daphniae TaxID=402297 RepID=A0A4P7UEX2_9ACTN|nr:alanine racemase [Nocardioides daphniae]QCC77975.1 alanine racemase [Nocardioides daphniae]GGD23432.1 alanine racemase [Nocardioides daphniae]
MTDGAHPARAEIVVDLDAVAHNVATLREVVAPAALMAVVKADGYGHGMVEVARVARANGADWLGVATPEEAVALRASGDEGRLLCWLAAPGDPYDAVLAADVDVAAYTPSQLNEIAAAAARAGVTARVHLKIDTGLSRGGATPEQWPDLCAHARDLERAGSVRAVAVWSHLVASDEPDHPANTDQSKVFDWAVDVAEQAGLQLEARHLANSAAAVLRPDLRHDMVRCGIAVYGLDPAPGVTPDIGLVPAMTVRGRLAMVKEVPAGAGVSYGHAWVAPAPTTLGLVPVGYAEGIPRAASPGAEVWVDGARRPVRGKVCMDQLVVDLDGDTPAPGSDFVLFGPGREGEPTAQEWAEAVGTINYEIVTRIGGRMPRRYVGKDRA